MEFAERALFSLYCGNDEKTAFDNLTDVFGKKYDLIAFLFFIYNSNRFLLLSPKNFDERFEKIGIDFTTKFNCTWENYNKFLNIIRTIKYELCEYLDYDFTLLDAHSFVWMFWLIDKYLEENSEEETLLLDVEKDTTAVVRVRIGQSKYREELKRYWDGKCSVTGCDNAGLLIASHIKPWHVCTKDNEWINPFNGLLLTPNLDKAFDHGYITFADNGQIQISDRLSSLACSTLGISKEMKLRKIDDKHRPFLEYHRNIIFRYM